MVDLRTKIIGCGSYLPKKILTNDDLSKMVDTSDEWIMERTGIRQRHIAAEQQTTSDLACEAAVNALSHANVSVNEIDSIIVATTTPDSTFPSTATKVQAKLGLETGFAFDVQAVCSGFIYGLAVADNFIRLGQAKTILLIGAETFSRILDWHDRSTCVLFGDGAGAVVLRAGENDGRGVLSTHLHSDGRYGDLLYVDGGTSSTQTAGHVRMAGPEVFRHAVVRLSQVAKEALEANDVDKSELDWLVPHQANKRIIDATAKKLGLSRERIVSTVDRHANTSAASIPLALNEAVRDGRIQPGQLLLMEAMGGGMTWGASLVRW